MKEKLFYFYARSLWRSGLVKAILFLLALSIGAAFALSTANIGAKHKLFWDLLLVFEAFWLHALTLLWAYELCKEEELLFLARLPLSTPLTRTQYEAGRFLAIAAAFLPVAAIVLVLNAIVASPLVVWQSFLYSLSAVLCGFIVLTLSRFFPTISAVLYSAALVIIGNGLDDFYLYVKMQKGGAVMQALSETLYCVLPNFSLFDRQSEAVSGVIGRGEAAFASINSVLSFWALPIAYAFLACGAMFALSVWRFKRQAI